MNESYEVVTAALEKHARALRELTDDLRQALERTRTGLTSDAYGELGQAFTTAVESTANAGRDALRSETDSMASAADAVHASAREYAQRDTDTATRLTAAGDGMDAELPVSATTAPASDRTGPEAVTPSDAQTRLASLGPPTVTAFAPADSALPPTPASPSLTTGLVLDDATPNPAAPSTSSFAGMNNTEQNRVRTQVRNGVDPAPGAERISATNIEAALSRGPTGSIPLYSPVGTSGTPLPAIRFSSLDLATRPELIRAMMSLDPTATGVDAQWPELRGGLETLAKSWNGPREMWVQVPAGTSTDDLRTMLEHASRNVTGVENLTVVFRDPDGNVLATAARPQPR